MFAHRNFRIFCCFCSCYSLSLCVSLFLSFPRLYAIFLFCFVSSYWNFRERFLMDLWNYDINGGWYGFSSSDFHLSLSFYSFIICILYNISNIQWCISNDILCLLEHIYSHFRVLCFDFSSAILLNGVISSLSIFISISLYEPNPNANLGFDVFDVNNRGMNKYWPAYVLHVC